jgi:hypothetical protein
VFGSVVIIAFQSVFCKTIHENNMLLLFLILAHQNNKKKQKKIISSKFVFEEIMKRGFNRKNK